MCKFFCNFAAFFTDMRKYVPYIAVIVAMMIWAGSGIAVKAALFAFSPMLLIIMRFVGAVTLMLIVGLIARQVSSQSMLALQRVERQDWWLFILAGFFQPFLYFILETYSYKSFATPTIAEAFLSTNPLMAPIFAWLFLRERVTGWNIAGIVISTAGMVILVLAGSQSFEIGASWAIPLALVTVSTAVAESIMLRRIPAHYSSLTIVFWMQLIGLIMFLLACCTGLDIFHVAVDTTIPTMLQAWCGIGYLVVMSTMTAFILFCYSVRYLGVTKANVFNNIRPVFTALLMLILFSEQLPIWKWIGIIIIVLGLFICQKREKR